MRPEKGGGGVAAELMAGSSGRPSPWRTPTPYLFLGFAFMMGLIAVALLVLICSRRKPTRRAGAADLEARDASSARALAPLDREPKVVVVMAGDLAPSFLARAKPLDFAIPAARAAAGVPDDGAAAAA
ncbi:unnamed protein product [Urochloa humidicola]